MGRRRTPHSSIVEPSSKVRWGGPVYGGFTNGMASYHDRDWITHQTILDGGGTNYHVVMSADQSILDGLVAAVNPPGFSWRPQKGIVSWEVECGEGRGFDTIAYCSTDIGLNVHCPPRTLPPGVYSWRYRGADGHRAAVPAPSVGRVLRRQ